MPSSISSSERLTASDRPGVAQPVPKRDVPARPWGAIFVGVLLMTTLLVGAWEIHWQRYDGAAPSYQNNEGLWAMQRRRIDHGEGDATVLIGASRVLFDVQLPVWERLAGERPIQLALEGTSPLLPLESLADDPHFTGRLLVGIAPDIYFPGSSYRANVFDRYRDETPAQRIGQWLSMRLIQPYFAFYDPDFALVPVVNRQPWPRRPGLPPRIRVRKLSVTGADRNTHLWSKVENDTGYRALARRIWAQDFADPPPAPELVEEQIRRTAAAVAKLRERGVPVLFVRPPSDGEYLAYEDRAFPRAGTWDVLLERTGAPGIHFQDYPELQGMYMPEWSHLSSADAERFTEALYRIIERDHADWKRQP